jgi:hypothetical protein
VGVSCDLAIRARVYPQPVAALESFEVDNGTLGLVLEVGDARRGTYVGEARVLFADARVGWIPTVHLALVDL